MKVGIITFQRAENFGAALQCRALYEWIKSMKCDAEVIDYRNPIIENRYRLYPRPRKNLVKYAGSIIYTFIHFHELKKRKQKFGDFFDSMSHSQSLTKKDIISHELKYDLIVSGSDQIWNPVLTHGLDEIYFLQIPGFYRRASYAVSLGDISNPQFKSPLFNEYVKSFDYLSCRESDAAMFISEKVHRDLPQVVDPTLLLTQKQWDKIIGDVSYSTPSKYIFVYYIASGSSSNTVIKIANHLSMQHNIPILHINMDRSLRAKFKGKTKTLIDAGPHDFIYLIKNASYVVTSSFHGTALSCIYQKDLFVVMPNEKDSRVKTIAEMFHLGNRVFTSYEDFINHGNKKPIDINTVEYKHALERSTGYLRQITNQL